MCSDDVWHSDASRLSESDSVMFDLCDHGLLMVMFDRGSLMVMFDCESLVVMLELM